MGQIVEVILKLNSFFNRCHISVVWTLWWCAVLASALKFRYNFTNLQFVGYDLFNSRSVHIMGDNLVLWIEDRKISANRMLYVCTINVLKIKIYDNLSDNFKLICGPKLLKMKIIEFIWQRMAHSGNKFEIFFLLNKLMYVPLQQSNGRVTWV